MVVAVYTDKKVHSGIDPFQLAADMFPLRKCNLNDRQILKNGQNIKIKSKILVDKHQTARLTPFPLDLGSP